MEAALFNNVKAQGLFEEKGFQNL